MKRKSFHAATISFFATIFLMFACVAGYSAGKIFHDRFNAQKALDEVREVTVTEPFTPANNDAPVVIDWDELAQTCPDIRGWIYCPDTKLHYPIVQGVDNSFYLEHLPNGSYNRHGAIFMDYRNSGFTDENILIYGHNMKDGSMFHDLMKWADPEFAKQHPSMYLMTPSTEYRMWVFSARQVEITDLSYQIDFFDIDKKSWVEECARKSYFASEHVYNWKSPVVTLSTCTANGENRFVVQGLLEKENKSDGGCIFH